MPCHDSISQVPVINHMNTAAVCDYSVEAIATLLVLA